MASLADSLVASSSRPLTLRVRADLSARRHQYQGRTYWVVKDPIGLRYFRFQEEEFAVLNMLKQGVSLEDIKQQFEREFAPHKITYQDLQQFIGTLHRSGLVISDAPGQGQQLKKRRDERTRKEWLGRLSNILALRFKGIDPDRLLTWLMPWTRWFFSGPAAVFFMMLAVAALLLIGVQFDVFRSRLPAFEAFFGKKNWLYLGATLAVTKVLHEFGHGLLCKKFGGECHEMGVMFLVLTPCLYCNVSDSWMLPNKWHRAAIGAGGIYVELVLASIATFLWWFSEPTTLMNNLALRVMFICSISTVLFNGNPLLRFDGYYILSDIVEIPNLRQKASKILQRMMAKHCLGLELPEDPFLPQRNQGFFALYTIAAVMYRWFVFFSILFFLNKVFEPYGLKVIGQVIAIMGLVGLVVQPLWAAGKFFHMPGRMDQVKWPRVYASVGIVAALLSAVLLIPFPQNVACTLEIQALDSRPVYVDVPGKLERVEKQPGDPVQAGDVIAHLSNPELELEIDRLESERKQYVTHLEHLRRSQINNPDAQSEIGVAMAMIEAKEKELAKRREDWERLTLRAPTAGVVMAPLSVPFRPAPADQLPQWNGSPFDERNTGMYLDVSETPLCQIGDPKKMEAVLAIDQADIEYVRVGNAVKIKLASLPWKTFTGTVDEIARRDMSVAPTSLATQAGGSLATTTDASGAQKPISTTYQASVPLDDQQHLLKVGLRGDAKIRVGHQTMAVRLWRYLARTFHFYM